MVISSVCKIIKVRFFSLKEINNFFQQAFIKMIENDSKDA